MKQILTSLLLLLACAAHSQTFTNITIRATRDIIDPGVSTNSANTSLVLDNSNAKDKVMIYGLIWMFNQAQASGFTNTFHNYLAKNFIKDSIKVAADAKNRADSALTLQRLTDLLTLNLDLLSAGDLSSLATIAAKAP